MQDLANFSSIPCAVRRVPHTNMILTATEEGSVVTWSMDTLEALFKMKVQHGVHGLRFVDSTTLVFHVNRDIYVILLRHFFTTFLECNSQVVSVELVVPGIVMCCCEVLFFAAFCFLFRSLTGNTLDHNILQRHALCGWCCLGF
jgi:hypothetical protein